MLTGDLIEAYHRGYLDVEYLNKWAMELLESNYESEGVIIAASCPDLSWQEVNFYFKKILNELNITNDIDNNIEKLKQKVFLKEYKLGFRLGGQVLSRFDSLRKEIGFYDMVGFTIIGDDYEGEDKGGYHTLDRKLYGQDLEKEIRIHLQRAGKI
ncbi:MAG: hypothetical protein H7Y18_12895 [Clostridiaceae bacterium]|nr:hypothetical protein [Clostridiaceae bacterium]